MATIDGSIQLVKVVTDAELRQNGGSFVVAGRMAQPIQGFDTLTKRASGGNAIPVYVVSDAQIANGTFRLKGGSALPMADIDVVGAGVKTIQGAAIPVYVVSGALAGAGGAASTLLDQLEAYWKLDEASGTRVDSAGNNNNLADNNTVTSDTGKINLAAKFTAANSERLSIASNASLSFADESFTLAGWVSISDKGITRLFVTKGQPTVSLDEYWLGYSSSSDRFRFAVSNGITRTTIDATTLGSPTINTWYFIVGWHDAVANTVNIQVNNGTVDSAAHTVGCNNGSNEFRLGAFAVAPEGYYQGLLDEIGIWRKALSVAERTELYNEGDGISYPFDTAPAEIGVVTGTAVYSSTID